MLIYFLSFSHFGSISWSIIQNTVYKINLADLGRPQFFSLSLSMLCNRTKPKFKTIYLNKLGWIKLNRSSLKFECYHFEKHHIVWCFQFNGIEPINFRWSLCERCTQWSHTTNTSAYGICDSSNNENMSLFVHHSTNFSTNIIGMRNDRTLIHQNRIPSK